MNTDAYVYVCIHMICIYIYIYTYAHVSYCNILFQCMRKGTIHSAKKKWAPWRHSPWAALGKLGNGRCVAAGGQIGPTQGFQVVDWESSIHCLGWRFSTTSPHVVVEFPASHRMLQGSCQVPGRAGLPWGSTGSWDASELGNICSHFRPFRKIEGSLQVASFYMQNPTFLWCDFFPRGEWPRALVFR